MDSNVQRNSYDYRKPDSIEIVCNYYHEFVKFENYQESLLLSSSSTPIASIVALDGSTSSVLGSGTIHLTPSFSLSSDRVTMKTIGRGYELEGLYLFDHQVPQGMTCPIVPSPFEFHCRLGHPSLFVLKKLYPEFRYLVSPDVAFFEDTPFTLSPSSSCQGDDDNLFIYEVTSPTPSSSTVAFSILLLTTSTTTFRLMSSINASFIM
ncbi:putative Polyprotein [Cucumis melo var. makuwa]|uniref:Polyprotein n=1 Tax=Cucumis melo var. makuwa TaxID=1194695 RepID=A0A5D3DR85_CUCMM|nr:putative Polyprotein [Cucumis melo var. makuwa]TYK26131.1 putative Polyprotein [Cucumis melo var. makuwa]